MPRTLRSSSGVLVCRAGHQNGTALHRINCMLQESRKLKGPPSPPLSTFWPRGANPRFVTNLPIVTTGKGECVYRIIHCSSLWRVGGMHFFVELPVAGKYLILAIALEHLINPI
jgi:hypothetical protein